MNSSYYQKGNTVKFKGRFGDFEEVDRVINPDEVYLIIYNNEWEQVHKTSVTEIDQDGFYIAYHVFDKLGTFYYEWLGLFNGLPSLERKQINIKWI